MKNRLIFWTLIPATLVATQATSDIQSGVMALDDGDPEAAAVAFETAFEAGDPDGAFYLGRMIELGLGTEPNLAQAAELYKVAADQESALAMNRLGLLYLDGDVVIRDYAFGAELICKAADLGEPNAQFNCGAAYSDGRGLVQDGDKALEYWQLAAEQNHVAATNFVALAYKAGEAVEADSAKSFELFSKTADEGNPLGLFEVALAYSAGEGTELSLTKAYTFANLAASRGHPDGPALRDQLEAELTTEEITAAQAEARAWIVEAQERAAASGN